MEKKSKLKKRKMLSYEDEPIETYERDDTIKERQKREEKAKNKKKIFKNAKTRNIVIIIILLVLAVGIMSVWRYASPENFWASLSSSSIEGNGFPVQIKGKTVNTDDISILNNNFAYISDTQFQVINSSGGLVTDKRIKYSSPTMVSGGNYNLIYDTEGTGYQIETATGTIFEGNTEDTIYSAVIIGNGSYAILSKKDGYTSRLTVFDKNHKQKYSYSFSECYAISISLNKNASKAVVCGLDAMKGSIVSRVYVLDFSEKEPVAKIDFPNTTTYKVSFLDNGNIALIGDTSAMVITNDYQNKYEFTYNGYNLVNNKIVKDKMVLILSPFRDGKSCEIWTVYQNGTVETIKSGKDVTGMDTYDDYVALLGNNKVTVFNTAKKEQLQEYDVEIDTKNILYFDEHTLYLLGASEIRQLVL